MRHRGRLSKSRMSRLRTTRTDAPRAPSEALGLIRLCMLGGRYGRSSLRQSGWAGVWLYARAPRRWRGPWTEREQRLARVCRHVAEMLEGDAYWLDVLNVCDAALRNTEETWRA